MDADYKIDRPTHPRESANFFEIITFSWIFNIFKTGLRRELDEKDLYKAMNNHKSSLLGNQLEKKWNLELTSAYEADRKPNLLRPLISMFGTSHILIFGILLFVDEIILKICQPLLIGKLISYFNADGSNKTDVTYAYLYTFGLLCNISISLFIYNFSQLENMHCGMKMRVACCSLIFRKALRLSYTALRETTVGQMINLLSNDVNRFDRAVTSIHYLWIGPVQIIVVTYFLWQEIGISSVLGIVPFFFFIPLQAWMGRKISEYRIKSTIKTDARLRLMTELITGIQVIKMYTWEKPFANLIEYARKMEIQQIKGATYVRIAFTSLKQIQIRLQIFISILTYAVLGNYISVQKVYTVTSFYSLLERTMTIYFNRGMENLSELLVSNKRIQNFLLHEEKGSQIPSFQMSANNGVTKIIARDKVDITGSNIEIKNSSKSCNNHGIVISNVYAKWIDEQTFNTLENINLTVEQGSLVVLIGSVGAGKSSIIQAILGELPVSKGRISVSGTISYASQDPWLFVGSIRQNILFDSPMDQQRYDRVIKICALSSDFEKLPYGDKTIVSERGVNLSGGQRARINLARAVYKQADIYLLDDPLSAVDTHVGKHLFEECIKDFLKEKICLLTTHQIQYLTDVRRIVLMKNANILAYGSYQELQASGYDFVTLVGKAITVSESNKEESNANYKNLSVIYPKAQVSNGDNASFKENKPDGALGKPTEEPEIRSSGNLLNDVYISYFLAGGNICKVALLFLLFILTQVLITGGDYWISFWINEEQLILRNEYKVFKKNGTLYNIHDPTVTIITLSNFRQTCVTIYIAFMLSLIAIWLLKNTIIVSVCTRASINLHINMFNSIIRSTLYFFKTNKSGRIFNRFSKDMGAIDDDLPYAFADLIQTLMVITGIIFVVGLVNIYLMIPTFIIAIVCHNIKKFYLPTSRSLKRLEGITRSPVFANLSESIAGLTTIRAYGAEKSLSQQFDAYQDMHTTAYYMFISSNSAFGLWLDMVCVIYISIVTLSFLRFDKYIYVGNVGLALTQIISLSNVLQWGIKLTTMMGHQMTSVERVLEYTNITQETDPLQSSIDILPPKQWPDKGKIEFKNFNLRYSQCTPYVLKNLNFRIDSMEKVGIVGRTGAGKSSLIVALFRLAINEGNIIIDDIDIHKLGLQDLRSKIAIIPQEPVLFSGTIRTNLDRFDVYSDHILWNALKKVELKAIVEELPGGLNSEISEGGLNFSVGQRQLLCLARAIIRTNKIIILDEATANVDIQTDAMIQNTIRNNFRTCTVLTIAHRLNTIMDSDRVLVMEAGTVVEFDHPHKLLQNKDGFLYKLVDQTGQRTADYLHNVATENYNNILELRV